MTSRADLIARAVLDQFERLPRKRQPKIRDNGIHEWVPLSGIVAEADGQLTCLAVATGMKCLPSSKLSESDGVGIHDWHAEILTIRVFNRFLLDECQRVLGEGALSNVVRRCSSNDGVARPFQIREHVKLHMYCSEAPCGDASMELAMAAQDDPSPWAAPPKEPDVQDARRLPGRAYFSQLGVVRRKPARGDAMPTLSKSCSDKLALKQCTSLLSSITSLFVDPATTYIDTLVLPRSQHSAEACRRAFSESGRMAPLAGRQPSGSYALNSFSVESTDEEFRLSKRAVQAQSANISASNLAAAWSASGFEESIIGGVIQGRKLSDKKGASRTSRRQMWMVAKELACQLDEAAEIRRHLDADTYRGLKNAALLTERRQMKEEACRKALMGWVSNNGDSDFGFDHATQSSC